MFSLLVVISMLVTLSLGQTQSCKSFLLGALPYPLDFCANYGGGSGLEYSYSYSCDGTTVMYNFYAKSGCSGTKTSTSASSTTMIKCDGDVCDNVAMVKSYTSTSCAASDSYISVPYVTGWCFEYGGASYKYACAGGNVTFSSYTGTTCADTGISSQIYTNMDCMSGSYYYEVTCDADPAGGSSSNILQISYIIYCILFLTIVKLL
jgi:hypothetical protein